MLSPRRTKYRKQQRGRMKGVATRGSTLSFGEFGLQALEPAWITSRQIEASRRAMSRHIRRGGKIWIQIFPDKPVTMRPAETRMGSGKGNPEFWVAVVKPGRILFEISGVPEQTAREAMRLASHKLPIKTKFIVGESTSRTLSKTTSKNQTSNASLAKSSEHGSLVRATQSVISKVDAYLTSAFELLENGIIPEFIGVVKNDDNIPLLPMVISMTDESWDIGDIPDFHVTSQSGCNVGCLGSKRTLEALQGHEQVAAVEASLTLTGCDNQSSIEPDDDDEDIPSSTVFTKVNAVHEQGERGDQALIAIIDRGIDILHDAFLNSSGEGTRIVAVLDQEELDGTRKGKKYTKADLDKFISAKKSPSNLKDSLDGTPESGHGTYVTSIAAGRGGEYFPGGVAPEALIVVVKLDPKDTLGDFHTHKAALDFINEVASDLQLPVVVNVSQGIKSGGRDGKSSIENQYQTFLEHGSRENCVVVKSAGNDGNTRHHVQFTVSSHSLTDLSWLYGASPKQYTIELWFSADSEMEFWLNVSGQKSFLVSADTDTKLQQLSRGCYAMQYRKRVAGKGDSQVLITIAGTESHPITGDWKLRCKNIGNRKSDIHAWITLGKSDSIWFQQPSPSRKVTLTIPGTAEDIITVGGIRVIGANTIQSVLESSCGLTRDNREKPDIVAPSTRIPAAKPNTNGMVLVCGTSYAAPQVTGAIALLLSAWKKKFPNLEPLCASKIRAAIRQTAQNYEGHDWEKGCGVLDAFKLLQDFKIL